jgi:two-component system, sensor histidine kinase and response regulator
MKILIAEDELDIAGMYMDMLKERGHEVTVTHDGSECIRAYRDAVELIGDTSEEHLSKNPPFDVVVLDYHMPNMDGLQAAKLILVANKRQRIIFASAYAKYTLEESVKELHAVVELLAKPFEDEVLIDIIENKRVHEELQKINMILNKQERIQVDQLRDMLKGLKKLKIDTPLISS